MNYTQHDIEKNMGLVHMVARRMKYLAKGILEFDDLIGEGTLGLIHALERYDPDRGLRFSTFAVKCIWGYVLRGHRNLFMEHWKAQNSRYEVPSITVSIFQRGIGTGDKDLDLIMGLDDRGMGAEALVHQAHLARIQEKVLEVAENRERAIIVLHLGLEGHREHTLREIGEILGLSHERCRQLESKVYERVREELIPELREVAA